MSSASLLAASMQKYKVAILVGEPTGGFATMYGNVIDAYLPNTGLRVSMPTSVIYGNQTGSVVPDHIVKQPVSDLLENQDAAYLFVIGLQRSGQQDAGDAEHSENLSLTSISSG